MRPKGQKRLLLRNPECSQPLCDLVHYGFPSLANQELVFVTRSTVTYICRARAKRPTSANPVIPSSIIQYVAPFTGLVPSPKGHALAMTSINFAAAQQRVEERRKLRAAEAQTRFQTQQNLQASNALRQLPFPLNKLGQRGLQTWDAIKGREGTRPAYRVGQVDAELLDEELLGLLTGQVGEGLKFFGVRLTVPANMSI